MSLHSLSRMALQSKINTEAPILTTRQHICFQNYVCTYIKFEFEHIIYNHIFPRCPKHDAPHRWLTSLATNYIYIRTSIAPNQVHCGPMSVSNLPVIAIRFLWVDAKPILPSLTNFCSPHFSE